MHMETFKCSLASSNQNGKKKWKNEKLNMGLYNTLHKRGSKRKSMMHALPYITGKGHCVLEVSKSFKDLVGSSAKSS